jgi:hypothetical protein
MQVSLSLTVPAAAPFVCSMCAPEQVAVAPSAGST